MQIKKGNVKSLTKAKGHRLAKVWKKTNQWYYCPACMCLYYFRVFKCRFDFSAVILCECGIDLKKSPKEMSADAKVIFPHFITKKGGKAWYESYLRSQLWREIRSRVLARDMHTCQRCDGNGDVVHHKSYSEDVIAGLNDAELVSLCFLCHEEIEFEDGKKLSLNEANDRLVAAKPGIRRNADVRPKGS